MQDKTAVLIIDDDENFCQTTRDVLEEMGYTCEYVLSGAEGVERIVASVQPGSQRRFSVVLLDMKMPVMNGLETYAKIREVAADLPVVMVTAFRDEVLINNAVKEGVCRVLDKPIDMDWVTRFIERNQHSRIVILAVSPPQGFYDEVRRGLKAGGYQVVSAAARPDIFERITSGDNDVVLFERSLSTFEALELFLNIKRDSKEAKVMVLVGPDAVSSNTAPADLKREPYYVRLDKSANTEALIETIGYVASHDQRKAG